MGFIHTTPPIKGIGLPCDPHMEIQILLLMILQESYFLIWEAIFLVVIVARFLVQRQPGQMPGQGLLQFLAKAKCDKMLIAHLGAK